MNYKIECNSIFFLLILFLPELSYSQNWQFKKEEKGIRVYTRAIQNTNNKLKELKITHTFKGHLNAVATVLADVTAYPNWVYKCSSSKTLKANNDWDIYFYSETELPWPLQNRDVVLHSIMYLDDQNGALISESRSISGMEKIQKGIIRVPKLHSTWTFEPIENGFIQMTYLLNSEPGGNIPDWLVNLAIDEGPIQTIKAFLSLLDAAKYHYVNQSQITIPIGRQ